MGRLRVMRVLLLAFSLVLITAASAPAASATSTASLDQAQQNQAQDAPALPPDDAKLKSEAQVVNPDDLGVSIDRIRLRFTRNSFFNNVFDPRKLKMTAYVDVVGKAPEIKLFGFDPKTVKAELTSQAVPYGAPTHGEIVRMLTPQEFRTPPMDLTAIINWLAQQLEKKEEK